ncbi:MAG: hypothetical protein ACHWZW_12915 [Spirulina sp.]
MDHGELRNKHFSALKKKYQVSPFNTDHATASSNFLYFVLRKAELGLKITKLEKRWMLKNGLLATTEMIALQEYQSLEQERLEAELLSLKCKFKIPEEIDFPPSSSVYSILWRVESGETPGKSEVNFLQNKNLLETVSLIQNASIFKKLKLSYKATQHIGIFPEEPLYSILKKLATKDSLSSDEEDWLSDHEFQATLQIYWHQEQEKKTIEEFSNLKKKYDLYSFPEKLHSSFLYPILKKIDQGEVLSGSECNWLQDRRLYTLLEINHRRREIQLFKDLKDKYQANQYPNAEPDDRLFRILQGMDSGSEINEADIHWLEGKELLDTAKIARAFHFRLLKRKYQIVGNLSVDPFYEIMLKLERGERLDPKQVVQLIEENQLSRHGKIAMAYHRLEAIFYEEEYQRTGNLWNLPSASSHWRKANESEKALDSTRKVNWQKVRESDLKSALWVTRGAAFRDLDQLKDAENCAAEAMDCQPESHQPYTLMGAIHYDRGEYTEGDQWFDLAVERGANDTDDEIARIVKMTKEKAKRREVVEYLLKKDPTRYGWAQAYLK